MCPLLLLTLRPQLVQTHASPVHASLVSVSSYSCWSCTLMALFPWCPSSHLTLHSICLPPLPQVSLGLKERDLMETFYFGLSVPRSLTVAYLSGFDLWIYSHLLWWDTSLMIWAPIFNYLNKRPKSYKHWASTSTTNSRKARYRQAKKYRWQIAQVRQQRTCKTR